MPRGRVPNKSAPRYWNRLYHNNNDGWPDVFVGDLANQMYTLFHNEKGLFEYVTDLAGSAR